MWAVFELDKPTLNGWSSYTPEGWVPLFESADRSAKGLSRIRETIESWSKSHGLAPGSVCWVMPDDEQPGSVRLQRLPAP
jgi:hypothetical protein